MIVPSRDVTNQTLSGREKLNYPRPGIVYKVTSRLGTGKIDNLFYSVLEEKACPPALFHSLCPQSQCFKLFPF
jgi:hypothetical protein